MYRRKQDKCQVQIGPPERYKENDRVYLVGQIYITNHWILTSHKLLNPTILDSSYGIIFTNYWEALAYKIRKEREQNGRTTDR